MAQLFASRVPEVEYILTPTDDSVPSIVQSSCRSAGSCLITHWTSYWRANSSPYGGNQVLGQSKPGMSLSPNIPPRLWFKPDGLEIGISWKKANANCSSIWKLACGTHNRRMARPELTATQWCLQ